MGANCPHKAFTSVELLLFPPKAGDHQKKGLYASADPLSRQFTEYATTKSGFILTICSVVNIIGKSKIASMKGKIATQFQELLQSPL